MAAVTADCGRRLGEKDWGLELVRVFDDVSVVLRRGSGEDSVDCGLLPEEVNNEVSASRCTAFRISWLTLTSEAP